MPEQTNQENNFKVKIDAFTTDPTEGGGGSDGDPFEAQFNPETIRREYEIKFNNDYSANNTTRYVKQYHGQGEETLSFLMFLDATASQHEDTSITERLSKFIDKCYAYDGSCHKIKWLKVTLGKDEGFFCHLKNMTVTYTKYKPDGEPQRVEIDVTFTHHTHQKNMARTANRSSPDMSHMIKIKDGDRLTLICDEIYSNFGLYTDIAKANNLTNFRNLDPGTNLIFPPISS